METHPASRMPQLQRNISRQYVARTQHTQQGTAVAPPRPGATARYRTIVIAGDSTSSRRALSRMSTIRSAALPSPNGFGTVTMRS